MIRITFIFLVLSYQCNCEVKTNYDVSYKRGIQAYLENRWEDCINYIENSLILYKNYRSTLLNCRYKCHSFIDNELDRSEVKDLFGFYELIIKNAYCLIKCEKYYFKNRPSTKKEVDIDFENKVPYDYLQLCYFKMDELEKAASCSYTFLVHNPGHSVMQNNLQYYVGLPGVDLQNIKYLEPKDYQEFYIKATQMYGEENFPEVIEWMEQALIEYLKSEKECQLMCENSMSSAPETDFIVLVANHFTYTLRCKIQCPLKLSLIHGQLYHNLFSNHYHYLQFAYYKTKQLRKSCEAVASYLLFHPNDTVMLENKQFYNGVKGVQQDWFTPREEAVNYYNKIKRQKELLQFIEQAFQFNDSNNQDIFLSEPIPPPTQVKNNHNHDINIERIKREADKPEEVSKWEEENGVSIIMKDKDLNGSLRFAADGLASQQECEKMISLAREGALHGDGYNGKHSPHTEFEMFEGLTIGRAAILTQRGILDAKSSQIFLDVSEKARKYVEMYFKLNSYLYFAYTHLVCRTALPDSPGSRTDLSHPVHADNCVLTSDGQCLKQRPAYTWRDYSAIVYLNENFEGGDFIFARNKETIQASVRPKCGRMVAFSAGKENLHGVLAVTKGRRCALAMWYTLDPKHKERERDFAEHVLSDLVNRDQGDNNVSKNDKVDISTLVSKNKLNLQSPDSKSSSSSKKEVSTESKADEHFHLDL